MRMLTRAKIGLESDEGAARPATTGRFFNSMRLNQTNLTGGKLCGCLISSLLAFRLITGLAVLISGLSTALGASFEVSGEASYDLFNSKKEVITTITNEFDVSVLGEQWRIVTWVKGSSNRLDCAYDSTCIRTLYSQFETTKTNAFWANSASIRYGESLSFDDPFLQTLWLAFCSVRYLQSSTNGMIEPIWTQDDPTLRSKNYRVSAMWRLSPDEPKLPVSVTFLNDGLYRGFDQTKKQPFTIQLPPPYQGGYTSAVFYATSVTNLNGGASIPTEFFFRTFYVPIGKGITPDMPRDTLIGAVNKVSFHTASNSFLPEYKGIISIHDFRFSQKYPHELLPEGFATYKSRDNKWPNGQELDSLVYKYTRSFLPHDTQIQEASKMDGKRNIAFYFLLIIFFAPAFFFLLKKYMGSRRQ